MSNLKALVKAHNNALRNLKLLMKEQNTFPKNVVYRPNVGATPLPWLPTNYVNRMKSAKNKYRKIHTALYVSLLGKPLNTPLSQVEYKIPSLYRHTSNWKNGENRARVARLRTASRAVQGNAATVLQKIWRGRQTRKNLTHPKPKPPVWPRMRRLAINLGLKNNNTTRGYTLTPNNYKKMNFMLKRK
jgi:hypothetical protein